MFEPDSSLNSVGVSSAFNDDLVLPSGTEPSWPTDTELSFWVLKLGSNSNSLTSLSGIYLFKMKKSSSSSSSLLVTVSFDTLWAALKRGGLCEPLIDGVVLDEDFIAGDALVKIFLLRLMPVREILGVKVEDVDGEFSQDSLSCNEEDVGLGNDMDLEPIILVHMHKAVIQ